MRSRKVLSLLLLWGSAVAAQQQKLPAWALGNFVRPDSLNPIISPDPLSLFTDNVLKKRVAWESNDTFNPGATIKDGKIVLLYRAEDRSGTGIGFRTSRLGYAESADGLHFTRRKKPVLFPGNDGQKVYEWPGGCEDPRVAMTDNGTYVVFYTQWNRKIPRLGVATSTDLLHWKKHGPIFKNAFGGKFFNIPHKSASIITEIKKGRQVVCKINGKYWMYWGELGVFAASSADLINWKPVVDENGALKPLIAPRKGYFDSQLTECGPPAVRTKNGILLLYNGKNLPAAEGDTAFNANTYAAGQVLFDHDDPLKPVARLDKPFFYPQEPFEKSGQYAEGTVFTEGLVYFNSKWFLYYGCADSKVAVAVYDPAGNTRLPFP